MALRVPLVGALRRRFGQRFNNKRGVFLRGRGMRGAADAETAVHFQHELHGGFVAFAHLQLQEVDHAGDQLLLVKVFVQAFARALGVGVD